MTMLHRVGIDVAKASFDVALALGGNKYRTRAKIPNTAAGFAQLGAWLSKHAPTAAVGMEATGTYHEALAEWLVTQGVTVYVINPAQVHAFAQSELARTKTDRADAKLIARFLLAQDAKQKPLPAWQPLSPAQKRLRALVRRRDDLKTMQTMETNRLEVADSAVRESIAQVLTTLQDQIKETERAITQHIDDDPDLRGRRDLLTSIPGIAETTSAWLLASLGDLRQYTDVRQIVAHAGLDPAARESGTLKGVRRISRVGDATLRAKLYMPAVCAQQHNPVLRAFAERLAERGKPAKVILCALMRKLLHLAWGVLRSGKPFDPAFALA